MNACSSGETLVRLLEGQLSADERDSVFDHVEGCPHCQASLTDLTSRSSRLIAGSGAPSSDTDPWLAKGDAPSGCPAAGSYFGQPGSSDWSERLAAMPSRGSAPSISGYQILAELGHGGMGVVYRASQFRLHRTVALKMIRAGLLAGEEDLARFRIEAEAVAELRHPNIIEIYDIGEVEGLPFVALELLDGGSLDDRLGGTPQTGRMAASLVATLARAIHSAHLAGIIHRDLKPSNVLFTRSGTPKITDFGLAKRMDREGHTRSGQVLGSPSYIPPEQADGRGKDVGPAADVYALGSILYEMLTGRPPFKGTTAVETVMQVLNDDPAPPCRIQSQVPRDLETICLKCLAKEPARRYPSALSLAEDLERYLNNQPILARRTPIWERGVKWARRRPATSSLLASALLAAALLAGSGLSELYTIQTLRVTGWQRFDYASAHILDESQSQTIERSLFDWMRASEGKPGLSKIRLRIGDLLSQVQARNTARERYAQFVTLKDAALFQDSQLTGLDPAENARLVRESASRALELFRGEGASGEGWKLSPLADALPAPLASELKLGAYEMLLVLAEAVAQPLPGELTATQAAKALRLLDQAHGLRPPTRAYHAARGACLEFGGDSAGANEERAAARSIEPADGFDHFLCGREAFKHGALGQAKSHFAQTLQRQPNHFWAQCLLATCDLNGKPADPREAWALLNACLQNHSELPWLYLLRGFASGQIGSSAGSRAEAAAAFDAAEADYREASERDPHNQFRYALLANRGLLRYHSQRFDQAVADLNEAIRLNPRQYSAFITLAQIERRQNHLDLAIGNLDRAIALKPATLAPLYRTRGLWNLERRDLAGALEDLDHAIDHERSGSVDMVTDLSRRAEVLLLSKRSDDALESADRALAINPRDRKARRMRALALVELKRFPEAIKACDVYLATDHQSPELLELRGLARARQNDFAGAIEDYTVAISREPQASGLRARRGWAYLFSSAAGLAARDFTEAIRLDSSNADALSGHGSALIELGETDRAVALARESLGHGEPDSRLLYNAARILARAADLVEKPVAPKTPDPATARGLREGAVELLGLALERSPASERGSFWRSVVRSDRAITSLSRMPQFKLWAAEFAASVR
jgi:serine/threonine protein kinase/predicted Zn-dependent protease